MRKSKRGGEGKERDADRGMPLYRGCRLGDEREEGESERLDGPGVFGGGVLVNVENDVKVVCVSPLHLLAVDTMMRQIVRERS